MARKLTPQTYTGGPAKAALPKKKVTTAPKRTTLRPIPSGSLIRKPGSPRPATWRGAKKRTSPVRRRSR